MRKFRSYISLLLVAASIHYASAPFNYLYALEVERAKEQRVREIAAKLNVDPEFLLNPQGRKRFDFKGLFEQLEKALGLRTAQTTANSDQPLDIKESIARVKQRYALVAADTTLAKIAEALDVDLAKTKNKGQLKAHLNSVLRLIDKDFLPAVPEGLSGNAKSRDQQMRQAINKLRKDVKDVLKEKDALEEQNLEATLARLRSAVAGELTTNKRGPRWTKDPFPVKDTYKEAPKRPLGSGERPTSNPVSAVISETSSAKLTQTSNAITVPAEVAALAAQLRTPAKIFAWVHDNIDFEPYSGVAKGSLGTLNERSGNDWDQAVLLRDLLHSRGFTSQLEWGTVTLPMARAMNIAGTEDPTQAANLLATAGFEGVVLTSGNIPVGVQLSHAWVRSHIPYIPNRGATTGPADTWVRMDPSFKRYEYQAGIKINGKVAWNENEYLNTSAIRPPADFYGDKIWAYIRANNIDCINLSQVTKAGRIKQQNFPYVPSTLTSKIDSVAGTSADVPADQQQSVAITINSGASTIATYNTTLAATWGKKLSISFVPASPDDASTIAAYGGLFNTPAYLIRLKPVFLIDDQPAGEGTSVAAGAELDLNLRFTQPNVPSDTTHHNMVAGETHTIVLDAGNPPDSLIESRMNRLRTLTNEEQILSEKLYLVGLRYMQHVDDGIDFAAGVRWQRPVKRVFEADIKRQLDVLYNFAGAPLRLIPAQNNIDVARLFVGMVPIDNDLSNRAEVLALAGIESSYREASIWDEMQRDQGISAAKALLLARISGQQIQTVTSSNVDGVLASANLSADVEEEIRGAVRQGRIAKIAPNNVSLGRWTGTGYILQDPVTGAATYPISGGLAGGTATGQEADGIRELLGMESWLEDSPLSSLLRGLMQMLDEEVEPPPPPSSQQSDPVNMSSGNLHYGTTDLSLTARAFPMLISRVYNSRSTYSGPLGRGWTFNYGEELIPNGDGSLTYREDDGTEHHIAFDGTAYVSPAGKYLDVARDGSGWSITFPDGVVYRFDADGRLSTMHDLNGNQVTIHRGVTGLPTTIVDASGRTVFTFTTLNGKITEIADLGGRKVVYGYDGDDLVSVTDPAGKTSTMTYDLAHNLTSIADPLGNTQAFDYDADDRMFHHTDAVGAEEYIHYDVAGRTSVLTDRRGGDVFVQYDELGRATAEADPAGNVARASFDANNNPVSVIDSRGMTTTLEYDGGGNLSKRTNPDGGVVSMTYDANGRLLTQTDALGATTTNTYDAGGNLTESRKIVGPVADVTTNTYDANGQLLTATNSNGSSTTLAWRADGTVERRTDAAGQVTSFSVDSVGRVTGVTDPAGNTAAFAFDAASRLTSLRDRYGSETTFTYDAAGRRTKVHGPNGDTLYTYDGENRVLTATDPLGQKTSNVYNAAGDVVARTDPRGNTTRFEYDLAGRLTKLTDASGGVWSYEYCGAIGGGTQSCTACGSATIRGGSSSKVCVITDPEGNVARQEFDNMGRVVAITDPSSRSTLIQYDKAGRKSVITDANGNAVRYGYDESGRLVSVREANGGITSYTYDTNGNLLTRRNANGQLWSYRYDLMDRVIDEKDPLDRITSYTYDGLGNMKTRRDGKGQTVVYDYNVKRLTKVTYPDNSTETYTYDALGRRTSLVNPNVTMSYTYDAVGRLKTMTNQAYNLTSTYDYDAAGNRVKMTVPRSAGVFFTVKYVYDAKNRLASVEDSTLGMFRLTYDAMDRRTALVYPNGLTTSYAYDKAYRVSSLITKNAQGGIADAWSYQYDAIGNPVSRTGVDGRSDTFKFDAMNHVVDANYADGSFEKFTYDLVGNRQSLTTASSTVNYTYDVANQLLSAGSDAFHYDGNGNVIRKVNAAGTMNYTYNPRNQLVAASGPEGNETNLYAVDGRRIDMAGSSIENGRVRVFYDPEGNPILDYGTDNQVWTYRLYMPGVDEPLAEYRRTNGRIVYLLRDALGSITASTATDGRVMARHTYRAFGGESRTDNEGGAAPPTRLGFTGRERGVGSLMHYRARQYDSSTGRFMQQDPWQGEADEPVTTHQYLYAGANPVANTDPTGLAFQDYKDLAKAAAALGCNDLPLKKSVMCRIATSGIIFLASKLLKGKGILGIITTALAWIKLPDMIFLWEDSGAIAYGITATYPPGPEKELVTDVLKFALEAHAIASIIMFLTDRFFSNTWTDAGLVRKYIDIWSGAIAVLVVSAASGTGPMATIILYKLKLQKALKEIEAE